MCWPFAALRGETPSVGYASPGDSGTWTHSGTYGLAVISRYFTEGIE